MREILVRYFCPFRYKTTIKLAKNDKATCIDNKKTLPHTARTAYLEYAFFLVNFIRYFTMKKLVVSFVSAAALASASIAMAGGMDNMAAPSQASNSNAAGIIISGNAGYGKVNYNASNLGVKSSALNGFAWNANLGYQFNPYVAIESGYTHFNDINVGPAKIDTYGVDLLAKGIYPINSQFNVFAKAGAMDIFSKAVNGNVTARRARVTPEFGVGTSYNMTHNLALTVQGITTLAMKGPHAGTFTMPATYAAYAGLSYKFNV